MREVILDTETTGLDPQDGHRIVEIGAIELINRLPTGRVYHTYINPQRVMPPEAFKIHGLSDGFLRNQPIFADVAEEFLAFVREGNLVIHNASFDMKFINAELAHLRQPPLPMARVVDTLAIARKKFPGSKNNLDALCARFGIKAKHRTLHGALLDAELLVEVYLELHGGRQLGFSLGDASNNATISGMAGYVGGRVPTSLPSGGPASIPPRDLGAWALSPLSTEEKALHATMLKDIKKPLWHHFLSNKH